MSPAFANNLDVVINNQTGQELTANVSNVDDNFEFGRGGYTISKGESKKSYAAKKGKPEGTWGGFMFSIYTSPSEQLTSFGIYCKIDDKKNVSACQITKPTSASPFPYNVNNNTVNITLPKAG